MPSLEGIGLAFAFDALTFLVSVITLAFMRNRRLQPASSAGNENMLAAIREGIQAVWQDPVLRVLILISIAINFLLSGPLSVGIPFLADTRFPEGSVAFGAIMSAFGGGMLLGNVLAGVLPRPAPGIMGMILLSVGSIMGIGLALLGLANTTALAVLTALLIAVVNGYINILFITWLQARTPEALLGRVMSLMMVASIGFIPISNALSGALLEVHATGLFVVSGGLLTVLMIAAVFNPRIRSMDMEPAA